ncbi:hypothetical protein [Flavihumibacter sp. CACIAM 22H1]|uniref:hypothetical protein n=1 Tax=Flavihumibacter sp. CACIAM 22H1 TaxID=1812911 RepID=UPI0007A8B3A7|nr:hypothetical protein [Flavihumibacter sp. CACIAM 22H1]KYP15707.1 MAG: hypothetical protein A1D16_19290 [Flavihumibacter sp. CACIAM 22H1]
MKNTLITGGPNLFGWRKLVTGVTLLFMVLLGTTLVMLPLVSKQNKACILNTVEEEAGNNNPINEEHKSGKPFSISIFDYSSLLGELAAEAISRIIPVSENIPDDQHSQTLIQPPDLA